MTTRPAASAEVAALRLELLAAEREMRMNPADRGYWAMRAQEIEAEILAALAS